MIIRQSIARGQELPRKIRDAPDLFSHNALFLNAFFDLISSRALGFGAGPLEWLPIHQYCLAHHLDEDATTAMHLHLHALDKVYLAHVEKKNKAASKGKN